MQRIEGTIRDLQAQVEWYKQENSKLLDRLLVAHSVKPMAEPIVDNRSEKFSEALEKNDLFEEISEAEYARMEKLELEKS